MYACIDTSTSTFERKKREWQSTVLNHSEPLHGYQREESFVHVDITTNWYYLNNFRTCIFLIKMHHLLINRSQGTWWMAMLSFRAWFPRSWSWTPFLFPEVDASNMVHLVRFHHLLTYYAIRCSFLGFVMAVVGHQRVQWRPPCQWIGDQNPPSIEVPRSLIKGEAKRIFEKWKVVKTKI